MSDKPIKVLLIEDNQGDARLIREMLVEVRDTLFDLKCADRLSTGLEHLAEGSINVVLLDLSLPDSSGLDTFDKAHARAASVPIIVLTGLDDEELAVKTVQKGAQDYLVKGRVDGNLLGRAIRYSIERKRAEETLRESEGRLKEAQRIGMMGDWEFDVETQQIRWSEQLYQLFERNPAQGPPTYEENMAYYYPPDSKKLQEQMRRAIESGEEFDTDYHLKLPSGKSVWQRGIIKTVKDNKGEVVKLYGTAQDITERKQMEEKIKASLKEKEVLLREIHHRVKNNLQIISSLLSLQSRDIKNKETLEVFNESQNRIRTMALIHEELYQSKNLAKIDFAGYIRSLATYLFRSYEVNSTAINMKINVDDVSLGIDTAIPCGLIINELVSNSLKHAFPEGKEGEIRIDLRSDNGLPIAPSDRSARTNNKFTLIVSDNGVGFPDLNFRNTESLGLRLVNALTNQLEGTIELDRSSGTAFKITFAELQ